MPLAEYEREVGPLNRHYHELAEYLLLYREGILPLEDEDSQEKPTQDIGPSQVTMKKDVRRSR